MLDFSVYKADIGGPSLSRYEDTIDNWQYDYVSFANQSAYTAGSNRGLYFNTLTNRDKDTILSSPNWASWTDILNRANSSYDKFGFFRRLVNPVAQANYKWAEQTPLNGNLVVQAENAAANAQATSAALAANANQQLATAGSTAANGTILMGPPAGTSISTTIAPGPSTLYAKQQQVIQSTTPMGPQPISNDQLNGMSKWSSKYPQGMRTKFHRLQAEGGKGSPHLSKYSGLPAALISGGLEYMRTGNVGQAMQAGMIGGTSAVATSLAHNGLTKLGAMASAHVDKLKGIQDLGRLGKISKGASSIASNVLPKVVPKALSAIGVVTSVASLKKDLDRSNRYYNNTIVGKRHPAAAKTIRTILNATAAAGGVASLFGVGAPIALTAGLLNAAGQAAGLFSESNNNGPQAPQQNNYYAFY